MKITFWEQPTSLSFIERLLFEKPLPSPGSGGRRGFTFEEEIHLLLSPIESFSICHNRLGESEPYNFITDASLSIRSGKENEFWRRVQSGIPLIPLKRGGGILAHGPGQVILDPAIDGERRDIGAADTYLDICEYALQMTLGEFGIKAEPFHYAKGAQGMWVSCGGIKKKVGFFGLFGRCGIIFHGMALNVSNDLSLFSLINPCDLVGAEATSMQEILGSAIPSVREVADTLLFYFLLAIGEEKIPA